MKTVSEINALLSQMETQEIQEEFLMDLFQETVTKPCYVCGGKSFVFALAPEHDQWDHKPFCLPSCRDCTSHSSLAGREIMQVALADVNEVQPSTNTPVKTHLEEIQEAADELVKEGVIFIKGYNESGEPIYVHRDNL